MTTDEQTRSYYDEFSANYDEGRDEGYHALVDELELRALESYIRDANVLEAGCGTGLIMERLKNAGARCVTGIDMSEGMLKKAQGRAFNVACGSVTAIPFASDTFDVSCSFKVLPHVPNIGLALSEMSRVTRPGGIIAAEFYNPWSVRFLSKRIAGPQQIGAVRDESDVYTRWDSPLTIERYLPPNVEWVHTYGIRIMTPFASAFRSRWLGGMLRRAEAALFDSSLKYFGGFVVVILRKKDSA